MPREKIDPNEKKTQSFFFKFSPAQVEKMGGSKEVYREIKQFIEDKTK